MSACRRVWDFNRLPFRYLPSNSCVDTMLLETIMLAREVLLFHTLKTDVASRSRAVIFRFSLRKRSPQNERDDVNILRRLLDRRKRSRCTVSTDGMDSKESPMTISIMPARPTEVWPAVGRSFCIYNSQVSIISYNPRAKMRHLIPIFVPRT